MIVFFIKGHRISIIQANINVEMAEIIGRGTCLIKMKNRLCSPLSLHHHHASLVTQIFVRVFCVNPKHEVTDQIK